MTEREHHADDPSVVAAAWRYRWVVLGAALLTGLIGYVASAAQDPVFEATARLYLTDPRSSGVFGATVRGDSAAYIQQQGARVESSPVLQEAADRLDSTPRAVSRAIEVNADVSLQLVEVRASAGDAEQAAAIANAAARSYQDVTREQRLAFAQAAVEELEAAQAALDAQIRSIELAREGESSASEEMEVLVRQRVEIGTRAQQLLVDASVFGAGVDLFEPAEAPVDPTSPSPRRDAVLLAVLGAVIATAGGYWRLSRPTTVESRAEVGAVLGIPWLGSIPVYESGGTDLAGRLDIDPGVSESYHFVLSAIVHDLARVGGTTLMVTSASPGEGKTEVSLQLAAAALLEGRDPLLVDGDLRLRRLSKMAGADGELGLVDLADGPEEFYQRTVRRLPVFQDALRLRLLPAGSTADMGAGSIRRPGVARFFRALSESGELTIVDSAPVLATADTTVLGSQVDAVVLVVREGTSREILAAVADRLRFVGSPVLGFVYVSTRDAATGRTGLYEYKTDRYVQAIAAADPVRSADEFEVSLPGLIEDEDEGGEAGADRAGGTAAGREPLGPQRPADSTLPSTEPTRPSS